MVPFAKCMQDSRIARAPPPPIHSFASFLEREREKEGAAIEIGDGQSASSTAAIDDDDDDADITGAWAASKEALQFFARNRLHFHGGAKQKTFP